MIEEPNYYAVHNASIAHDDEQIEAHKICLRKQSKCGLWHPATDSGILLQIQASCYRFRHLLQIQTLATDSGTCYRFRHLLQIQAFCYRFRQSTTESCNLLQSHAICYRVTQSATESRNLLQSHAICYRVMQSATESGWCKGVPYSYVGILSERSFIRFSYPIFLTTVNNSMI